MGPHASGQGSARRDGCTTGQAGAGPVATDVAPDAPVMNTPARAGAAGTPAAGSGGDTDIPVEAKCGEGDNPETGLQGDVYPGTVNCGLTLLSKIPFGGSAQGSGHCAFVRTGSAIKSFSLADPLQPVETDEEPTVGGSESMRAHTVDGRAVLVSGKGVYDVSNCEELVKKGEIQWPSANAQSGLLFAALSSHEISISHDAKRVYSGLGFAVAHIEDLENSASWKVNNWSCEMNKQSMFPGEVPSSCEGPTQEDLGRHRQCR